MYSSNVFFLFADTVTLKININCVASTVDFLLELIEINDGGEVRFEDGTCDTIDRGAAGLIDIDYAEVNHFLADGAFEWRLSLIFGCFANHYHL